MVLGPGVPLWLVRSPVKTSVMVAWCDVSCGTMALLQHSVVRSVDSGIFTRRGNTGKQAVEKQTQTAASMVIWGEWEKHRY